MYKFTSKLLASTTFGFGQGDRHRFRRRGQLGGRGDLDEQSTCDTAVKTDEIAVASIDIVYGRCASSAAFDSALRASAQVALRAEQPVSIALYRGAVPLEAPVDRSSRASTSDRPNPLRSSP
eukprot:7379273-Prymnesium_polylepis.1